MKKITRTCTYFVASVATFNAETNQMETLVLPVPAEEEKDFDKAFVETYGANRYIVLGKRKVENELRAMSYGSFLTASVTVPTKEEQELFDDSTAETTAEADAQ